MKKYLPIFLMFLFSACSEPDKTSEITKLNIFMDSWHNAAAIADEDVFFNSMDTLAVYLGTDPNERWLKHEFMEWGMKYFEHDTAWAFRPYKRIWNFSDDMNYAWFDELLETHMGVCRGSGVLKRHGTKWKIVQYNLALTLPNDQLNAYRELLNSK